MIKTLDALTNYLFPGSLVPETLAFHHSGCQDRRSGDQCLKPVVLNLCYSDVFELQLPETPASTVGGEGFWELQSKTLE